MTMDKLWRALHITRSQDATNEQTNKKEEKCVTKYWRTSLTKYILEAYFPALKR